MQRSINPAFILMLSAGLLAATLVACSSGAAAPPEPPQNLTAEAISAHNTLLSWRCPPEVPAQAMLVVERVEEGEGVPMEVSRRPMSHGRYLDLVLRPQRTYTYQAKVCVDQRCSPYRQTEPVTTFENLLPHIDITVPYTGPDTGEVYVLSAQDWLDPDLEYASMVAMKRDGTVIWSQQNIAGGLITEVQPLPDDHTLAVISMATLSVMDLDGTFIYRYDGALAHHDVDRLSDGRFIYLYWQTVLDEQGNRQLADGIEIVDPFTNEVKWRWQGIDHIPFTDMCDKSSDNTYGDLGHDWTHANAVTFDEADSAIYFNVRNLNRIYKIAYPTGDVEWIMGDGGDFGEGIWSHCHDPVFFAPGRVLLLDNGLHRKDADTSYSRAIIVDYDPQAHTAGVTYEYRETPDFFCYGYGNAAFTKAGMLVCDALNMRVLETDLNGNKIFEMKYEGFYTPFKANVVDMDFFQSWGGPATEYHYDDTGWDGDYPF